jgi:galacturonosyltransferase
MLANSSFGIVSFRKELIVNFIRLNHEVHISVPYDTTIEQVKILGCNIIDTVMNSRGKNPIEDYLLYKHYIKIISQIFLEVLLQKNLKYHI